MSIDATCLRAISSVDLQANFTQRISRSRTLTCRHCNFSPAIHPSNAAVEGCAGIKSSTVGATSGFRPSNSLSRSMTQPIPLTATRFTPNPSAAILTESEQCEQSRENEWLLEIRVRPEDVAGFKQDYEAIAETWPSDLRTTRDAVALEDFVIDAAALVQKWLPRDVLRRVTKFNSDASQPSALVIRGLPIDDDLPPTTAEGAQIKVGKYMSETWLAGIGRVIGQPFNLRFGPMESLKTGGLGMLFKDILPVLSEEEKVSQNGSAAYLDLHCDYFQCVQECWVHTLAFIGIRGDPQLAGRTLLADFREIYKRASSADIELLRAKPITWRFGPRPEQWFSQLIIDGSDDNPHIYLFDEMVDNFHQVKDLVSGDPDVVAAYRRMKVLGRDLALEHGGVRLEGGDVLLLNQRRVAHGRNGFEAKYDGNDRWLQKLYVNEGQIWQPHGHSPWPERVLPYVVRKTSS